MATTPSKAPPYSGETPVYSNVPAVSFTDEQLLAACRSRQRAAAAGEPLHFHRRVPYTF